MYKWADEINWDHVDKIILVSRAKQQEFSIRFPTHASKACVVSPSTSLERFSSHSRVFSGNIGILCHITPRKRVYELILDFYQLQKQRSDLKLYIAGGPNRWEMDYHVAVQRLVDELDIRDKIIFHGPTDESELWYRNIDIFVSHSYSEGLQVSPMEAMATGCYCLSHWWDGADELLPERNLYYTGNELNEKILAYCQLADEEKDRQRALMQSIARDRFDIKQTARKIRSIIELTV